MKDKDNPIEKEGNLTKKLRENPFIISTIVLVGLTIFLLFILTFGETGGVISEYEAMDTFEKFAGSQLEDINILGAERNGNFYKIAFNSSETGESAVYITADGKYLVTGLIPLSIIEDLEPNNNTQPILECIEPYGISSDTIIFYYSNQCGWCAKMKPGVEDLEKEGYKFHWVEGSDTEALELIDNCIRDYMTSGGVPQFICPKTEEMYVGAFVDENGNLDQLALKEWVDNCISS